jgi:hypothetical protein
LLQCQNIEDSGRSSHQATRIASGELLITSDIDRHETSILQWFTTKRYQNDSLHIIPDTHKAAEFPTKLRFPTLRRMYGKKLELPEFNVRSMRLT